MRYPITLRMSNHEAEIAVVEKITNQGTWEICRLFMFSKFEPKNTRHKMETSLDEDYLRRLMEFPCAFNLININTLTTVKLKTIQHNLLADTDMHNCKSEQVRNKNLLTLVYFRLDNDHGAIDLSNKVNELTEWKSIASLGNRCFLMWKTGDELEAKRCLKNLEKLKEEENYHDLFIEARAEQAYYYSRLGGPTNLKLAINLFSEAVTEKPDNYLWKYGLGLVCRRATHANIFCSSTDHMDVEKYIKMAAEHLFDVADNGDSCLQALAYSQLVHLRQNCPPGVYPKYNVLFRNLSIQDLCDKALENGKDMPSVLTQCGKALRPIDIDKSIQWLEKCVDISEKSQTFHYLGKSFVAKAEEVAKGKRKEVDKSRRHSLNERRAPHNTSRHSSSEFREVGESQQNWTGNLSFKEQRHTYLPTMSQINQEATYGIHGGHRHPSNTWTSERNWRGRGRGRGSAPRQTFSRSASYNSTDSAFEYPPENVYQTYRHHQGKNRSTSHTNIGQEQCVRGSMRGHSASVSGSWSPQNALGAFVVKQHNFGFLDKDDEFVKKAFICFTKSIELAKENLPAVLDLGILLKKTGQLKEALTQFNIVTNSHLSATYLRVTVISAYEQAGLCYLELSKTAASDTKYEEEGRKKLTKAVSLAADLTVLMPELKDSQSVWTALRTMLKETDQESPSPMRQKKKIKVLEIAGEHGKIIDAVQKLREYSDDELNDPYIVTITLNSYLIEKQPENALAFQNFIGLRTDIGDWWTSGPVLDLRIKVLLVVVSERLKESTENPTVLFQQLFQLTRGACCGIYSHDHDQTNPVEDSEAENLAGRIIGDVLVVYDGDFDSEESPSLTTKSARCLKEVATGLFGLEAEENLKGTGEFGDFQSEVQLKVMKKYQVLVIVLGSEIRAGIFDAVLKCLSSSRNSANHQRIVIMDAGLQESRVPLSLTQYECLKLEDIGGLGDIAQVPGFMEDDGQLSFVDILHHVFHGDVDAVMKLFCFMIGKQWPCP